MNNSLKYCIDDAQRIVLQGNQEAEEWSFLQVIAKWGCDKETVENCASDEEIELYKDKPLELIWYLPKTKYFPLKYDDTMVMRTLEIRRMILTPFVGAFFFDL